MLKILVGGGFNEDNNEDLIDAKNFAHLLGKEVIDQGHILVNACLTSFDRKVAESAHSKVVELGEDPNERIVSYVLSGQKPAHNIGNVLQSRLKDWELGSPRLRIPEPIEFSDVIILSGGFVGTHRAANWARIANKPILPVPRFGNAAAQIYSEELDSFNTNYGGRITKIEYESLSQVSSELEFFSRKVVELAERIRTSRYVFVIMSFQMILR